MICNKCKIDQPVEKFDTYFHSNRNKHYTRKICNPCMKIGYNQYKLKIKSQQIPVPVIPDDWKQCSDCKEYKPLDKFYLNANGNHIKRCKVCHGVLYKGWKHDKLTMNGGSSSYYQEPNRYYDNEQKEQVFSVMKAFGWIYDEGTGIWNKPGVKENGVFINMVLQNKPKRAATPGGGRKIKKGVWNSIDNIMKLIEEGHSYSDIADIYCCSHTLIRSVVSNYRNEKRAS